MQRKGRGMYVLALVTARGGSKGLPGKNRRNFLGRPLIAWSIEAALRSESVNRIVTTTDDAEVARIAAYAGSEVPFMRPPELAQDDTPDLPVFDHALDQLRGMGCGSPDIVVHLRPTSPLRPTGLIDRAVDRLVSVPEADSVRTVCIPHNNPYKMWSIKRDGFMEPLVDCGLSEAYNRPRQELPIAYWQTGAVDVVRTGVILEGRSMTGRRILPLVMPSELAVDIDDEASFRHAERVAQSCTVDGGLY